MEKLSLRDYAHGVREIVRGLRLLPWGQGFMEIGTYALAVAMFVWVRHHFF